jgi:hypothetical protein
MGETPCRFEITRDEIVTELARHGFRDYDTARWAEDLKVEALLRGSHFKRRTRFSLIRRRL